MILKKNFKQKRRAQTVKMLATVFASIVFLPVANMLALLRLLVLVCR